MSAHPAPYPAALSTDPASRSRIPGDDKAPFDDLIDQYAVSYKAHATDPPALAGGHGDREPPLYDLTHQVTNFSDDSLKDIKDIKSLEGHRTERLDWEYPPPVAKTEAVKMEKEASASWWEVIRATLIPDSIACRLYMLTVLVETTVDLAVEAELYLRLKDSTDINSGDQQAKKMPVYLSIFALAHVFQFGMALDAVNDRNTLQFIALTIFNALFLVYAIIQIGEVGNISTTASGLSIHTLSIIVPIVISVAELAYVGLAYKIYTEFGWKVYKFLGADRRMKTMFTYYQIFLCLVKFDLFFWVGFSVQFIWLVLDSHNAEYYLTCLALPLSILVLIDGHIAARSENKWMMYTFMTGCVGALVYFLYKLIKVVRLRHTSTFKDVWQTLTTFSFLAIVLLLMTFVFACMVMNNFGRGLANQMAKRQGARRGKSQDLYRGPMRDHPNRMSIE